MFDMPDQNEDLTSEVNQVIRSSECPTCGHPMGEVEPTEGGGMVPHLEVTESAMRRLLGDARYEELMACCADGAIIDDSSVDALEGSVQTTVPTEDPIGGCY